MTFVPIIKNSRIADFTKKPSVKNIRIKQQQQQIVDKYYARAIMPLAIVDEAGNGACISYDLDNNRVPEVLYFRAIATGFPYYDILSQRQILYRNNPELYLDNENPEIPDTKSKVWHYNNYTECGVLPGLFFDDYFSTGNINEYLNEQPPTIENMTVQQTGSEITFTTTGNANGYFVGGFIPDTGIGQQLFFKTVPNDNTATISKINTKGFYYAGYFNLINSAPTTPISIYSHLEIIFNNV